MCDATGVAEAMLGLPGFRVLDVRESAAEAIIEIEMLAELVGCPGAWLWPGPTIERSSSTPADLDRLLGRTDAA